MISSASIEFAQQMVVITIDARAAFVINYDGRDHC